jgi:gluconokinase
VTEPRNRPANSEAVPVAVVMGVAGSGKSVVGSGLAEALGATFIEGDQLQPPENVARMASGLPLNDEFRKGWLEAVGREIASSARSGHAVVAACSALKKIYRDRLRSHWPEIVFVYLKLDPDTARDRVALRKGHFMPASLVDSQFADLQPPAGEDNVIVLDATRPLAELVAGASARLAATAAVKS